MIYFWGLFKSKLKCLMWIFICVKCVYVYNDWYFLLGEMEFVWVIWVVIYFGIRDNFLVFLE